MARTRMTAAVRAAAGELGPHVDVLRGTLADVPPDCLADAIVYIDVLEHIDDDKSELELAARKLAPNGYLVVLSPAHPSLYSAFDLAIGHHRRSTPWRAWSYSPVLHWWRKSA